MGCGQLSVIHLFSIGDEPVIFDGVYKTAAQKEQTMSFKEISPEQAWEMMQNGAMLADVRDPQRFTYSHAKGAFHLTNQSFLQFEELVDFDSPIIVSCYHGVSSRNVATFLVEQGYENVFSVIGGFDGWEKAGLPIETAY